MSADRWRLTCLGDALMDFLPVVENGMTTGFRMAVGGSMLNVAVGLARLGAATTFAGTLADDAFGDRIASHLSAERVDITYLKRLAGRSTLAFVLEEAGEPSFAFYGEDGADALVTAADLPAPLLDETAVLHTGSTSLLRGTAPEAIRVTMEALRGRALLSLDPNIRPGLVRDEPRYRALLDTLLATCDILKLSRADLAWLDPASAEEDGATIATHLAQRGPALVALTEGRRGATLATAEGAIVRVAAYPTKVVDTVGAGDAFASGLLYALTQAGVGAREALAALPEEMLGDIGRWAAACSALTCARAGAQPPRRAEVEALLGASS